jgi:hypothetical protein
MKKLVLSSCMVAILFFSCETLQDYIPTGLYLEEAELDISTITAGLKEALEIGTKNAVAAVSAENGYNLNPDIRILLHEELTEVDKRLRSLGLGNYIDDFIVEMNRSAEEAAKAATSVFVDAILAMSISDARAILEGGERAATDYFENRTRSELYGQFYPKVKAAMDKIGINQTFDFIIDRYNSIPLVRKVSFDLNDYIVNEALDGLFHTIAMEERKIRIDPAARVTELLKRVFS